MQRRTLLAAAMLGPLLLTGEHVMSAPDAEVTLFKVVTVKDEIVIGLTADQFGDIEERDAPGIARALAKGGSLTVWRYTVAKGVTGDLLNVPLARVGLLRDGLVRIEPMKTPLAIVLPRESR